MEIAIWIAVQAALFGLLWWFVSSRRAKAERTIKRRPTERAREENTELRQLRAMRAKSLNMPLSEKARPTRMEDIVGQQEGIRALRAAMCGPNPQHVLIHGPPGIGKTAILSQLAQEEHVGLVCYTMTHHTRQSALGLPVIVDRTAAGRQFRATEYTMSEIIASVYAQMEKTGLRTGILFLDEINCVSETLMPAILQMLQNKTFGVHALPEGWMIAAAGNPPRYNQSARSFDMATLDRVRRIDLEPSLAVWQEYAAAHAVHPAVLAYLRLHPEHFFVCDAQRSAGSFVTARGWEDLSALLLTYEALSFACTQTQAREYLHVQEAAAGFTAFYELYRRYAASLPLEALLRGQTDAGAEALRGLPFEGRLSVVEFLLHSLQTQLCAAEDAAALAFSAESFLKSVPAGEGYAARAEKQLENRRAALQIRRECGVLSAEDERRETAFLTRSDAALAARSDAEAFDAVRLLAESAGTAAEQNRKNTLCALENSLRFVCAAFGDEQELWILLHGLQDCGAAAFLQKENSSVYQELLSRATPEAKAAALREELSRGAGL